MPAGTAAGAQCPIPGRSALTGTRLLVELGDDPDPPGSSVPMPAPPALTWASGSSSQINHRRIANERLKETGHRRSFANESGRGDVVLMMSL